MSKRNRSQQNRAKRLKMNRDRERRKRKARRHLAAAIRGANGVDSTSNKMADTREWEPLRAMSELPRTVWAYADHARGELFCPLGNQPSYPFTTHIFWDAINHVEAMLEATGMSGVENPPEKPGYYLICFRTKQLAEQFRQVTGIKENWASAECHTETMLRDAIGIVPFVVYVNDYVGPKEPIEPSGFRWRVSHAVGLDNDARRNLAG